MEDDRRRQEFWQTLLAMGFAGQAACTGAYSGVELDWRVFERGVFHTRAAELIMHFLLSRLDGARVRRDFFDCWPIGSPAQAREFRARAFRWLDEERRRGSDEGGGWPASVPVRRSYVDECRGVRFEAVLWALADIAARAQLRSLGAGRPIAAPSSDQALRRCRAAYARRTRDRLAAANEWRQTEAALRRQIGAAEEARALAHAEIRACRRHCLPLPAADNIPADASVADVERRLAALVAQAARLWAPSAAWVDRRRAAVQTVDDVVERRANAVRLDARRGDVRLAPVPADAWAQWLAGAAAPPPPFRGADVSLHAVAQMARASVAALRRSLGAPAGDQGITLDDKATEQNPLPDDDVVQGRVRRLDAAIGAQDARLARLRRLRAQLAEQRASVARQIDESRAAAAERGDSAAAVELLRAAAARRPTGEAPLDTAVGAGRAARLAAAWDELLDTEQPPVHVVGLAWPETTRVSAAMSFMSDAGGALSLPPRKRAQPLPPPDAAADALKRLRLLSPPHGANDVPDFLVD
ncbi:hypothetical protein GGF42_003057 [Coemansia sp. RSA 2424]|nr:hypothetical protein GGF42_003057 [Coemansia sp. RSA 2424]